MSPDHPRHLPVVTLAALYGAGGTVVGPRVADRLGVPFLDREISETVAKRTGLSESAIAEIDQDPRSGMDRLVANLGRASTISGAIGEFHLDLPERRLRAYIEKFLAEASRTGGVALGRGGMVVLRSVPWPCTSIWAGPASPACSSGWPWRASTAGPQSGAKRSRTGHGSATSGAPTVSTARIRACVT